MPWILVASLCCLSVPGAAVTMALQHWTVTWWDRELGFTVSTSMLEAITKKKKKKEIQFVVWKWKDYFPCALCRKLLLLTPFSLVLSALQLHYSTDSMEVKPIMTRKLRRRPNDPVPIPDKRRKPAPDILSWSHCWICSHCATHPSVVLYSKENEIKCQVQILTWEILKHNCPAWCVLKQYSSYIIQCIYRNQCSEIPWYPNLNLTVSWDNFFLSMGIVWILQAI